MPTARALPVLVPQHALTRISERAGRSFTVAEIETIVQNPACNLKALSGSVFQYIEGPKFVLLVRREPTRAVVVTALAPESVKVPWQMDLLQVLARSTAPNPAVVSVATAIVAKMERRIAEVNVPRVDDDRVLLTAESVQFCRTARQRLGISQQELADRIGVLRANIKRIECGQLRTLDVEIASRLHAALVTN